MDEGDIIHSCPNSFIDMSHTLISEIASNASKLHKEAVINREAKANNVDFMKGLNLTYNPNITFGVKKVPVRSGTDGSGLTFHDFLSLAKALADRDLTGNAALETINSFMSRSTNDEWNGWYRLILTRDLRAGFSESTINKAVKDVNKDFVVPTTPYMRCSLPEASNLEDITDEEWAAGVYSQVKYDGMFANVNVREDGFVWVTSRNGSLFPEDSLGIEVSAAKTLKPGTQSHGELTVYQDGVLLERQVGNGILNSVLKGGSLEPGQVVHFDAWDQIPLSVALPKGSYEVPYDERFKDLEAQIKATLSEQIFLAEYEIVHSYKAAQKHYYSVRKRKLEGTILKRKKTIWKDGTSKDQIKFKASVNIEAKVVGFEPGKGKNVKTFGSLICRSADDLVEFGVPGFTDKLRQEISDNREDWLGAIITVTINGLQYSTKAGKRHSVFLPRFEERRFDKYVADTLVQIEAQLEAAIKDE